MSQVEDIVGYMRSKGSITQSDAWLIGVGRLASRIHDISTKGYSLGLLRQGEYISKESLLITKANGRKTHIASYSIKGGAE